jgi:hypothetical protein
MIQRASASLPDLYERDETDWLETMSALIHQGRYDDLDYPNLAEFLADMAKRDRREVKSRLRTLLAHLLKWTYQPDRRSGSWRATIMTQRQELHDLASGGVLRNHGEAVLTDAYKDAVGQAAAETGLPADTFPVDCPYSFDQLLVIDVTE